MPEIVQPKPPVFRFAPSPNGRLHLGHVLSALLNRDMANAAGGRLLLRIEDIDLTRCKPEYEAAIYDDLAWLDFRYERPVRRQSEHTGAYRAALGGLRGMELVYPAFMSRSEVRAFVAGMEKNGTPWPCDPDGSPHYPPMDRDLPEGLRNGKLLAGEKHVWRLDMTRALEQMPGLPGFEETGAEQGGRLAMDPSVWGDVMLWRSDAPSSYHLSVTVDDALQGVTHVVRGLDLFAATPLHRLLQNLLDLPAPVYHHHRLVLDENGRKLSKSRNDTALASLRAAGRSVEDIRTLASLPG